MQVVDARCLAGGFACLLHGGQQQGDEHRDNRHHHQQFDERKAPARRRLFAVPRLTHHSTHSWRARVVRQRESRVRVQTSSPVTEAYQAPARIANFLRISDENARRSLRSTNGDRQATDHITRQRLETVSSWHTSATGDAERAGGCVPAFSEPA
jgi:hypothetical protein